MEKGFFKALEVMFSTLSDNQQIKLCGIQGQAAVLHHPDFQKACTCTGHRAMHPDCKGTLFIQMKQNRFVTG